jgi:predicted TIM-barrel fold metal-dependent hydrolase
MTAPNRRAFLYGLATTAATAFTTHRALSAQSPPAGPRRLDFHHHFASPRWIKKLTDSGRQGAPPWRDYAPARSIDAMDKAGVEKAFISCTTPGTTFSDDFAKERDESRSLARELNEFGARITADHKERFGLFAVLPLPDIDGCLREIEYAFDTLKADGVGLLTSYGTVWLGDKALEPVFDELNRRRAVVYSHPTDSSCCHAVMPNVAPGTIEWNTDTSRAIFSMINDGAAGAPTPSPVSRYPNMQFIWSHAGGTLVGLTGRFLGAARSADIVTRPAEPNSRLYNLRRFYYDTAQSTNLVIMQALKSLVGASQIVFGADYPYSTIVDHVDALRKCGFSGDELRGIDRENGLRLLRQ